MKRQARKADDPVVPAVKPEIYVLEDMLNIIRDGRVRVPQFQRGFV
jgi:hypothetical protein